MEASLVLAATGSVVQVFSVSHHVSMVDSWGTHRRCSMKCA
jgi:hypothetical protein